ncbi:MAG: DUF4097 family beta strand repeat-containing protein [Gemmatimonadota bacterium]|nr:DUF4097 family beta strand repeat-containing protein [Gemmatimonadota bacterium]
MRTLVRYSLMTVVALLSPATVAAQTTTVDTLISVRPDGRLELHNGDGTVEIDVWNRDRVRLRARRDEPVPIRIEKKGVALVVRSPRQMERDAEIDYALTVPASMDLAIHGARSPVTVRGTAGRVEVHTTNGAVEVRGGRERVEVHTINGRVRISGTRGRVKVVGVNGPVTIRDMAGEAVTVNLVNGAVTLDEIDGGAVEAVTVNGRIRFQGVVRSEGSYQLNAHNGGIVFEIPEGTSARVHVSTFNGSFRTEFPVTIEDGPHGRRFDFTLGAGEARVELTSFNGTIELRRPGS